MASKTAQRILLTSLEIFNIEGEANVTSVDIANELDISPGNLYYHFKGKEQIINELFVMYRERLNAVLFAPAERQLAIKEFFYFMYLIFETSHLFRFLYRNPSDLATKYPDVYRGFKRLLQEKEQGLLTILQGFHKADALHIAEADLHSLRDLIVMTVTQHINYFLMRGEDINTESTIQRGVRMVFFAVSPYLTLTEEEKQHVLTQLDEQAAQE